MFNSFCRPLADGLRMTRSSAYKDHTKGALHVYTWIQFGSMSNLIISLDYGYTVSLSTHSS